MLVPKTFQLWTSFSWKRWLRTTFGWGGINIGKRRRRARRRQRLELETLEGRIVPTTFTWTGATNASWNTANNWVTGAGLHIAPTNTVVAGQTDGLIDLAFPNGALQKTNVNNLAANTVINSITISGSGYSLSGAAIALGSPSVGSGNIILGSGLGTNTISFNIGLGQTGTFQSFIQVGAGSTLTLSGTISGPSFEGLTKQNGTGTLILTGNNTFAGTFNIQSNSGIVNIQSATALGSTVSGTIVGDRSQLQVQGGITITGEALTLNGSGTASNDGALLNVSGDNVWAGPVTLASDVFFGANANSLKISGIISDLGSGFDITKVGVGTVIFSNANTYRGATTVNNGILQIQNALALGQPQSGPHALVTVQQTANTTGTLQINDPVGGPGVGFTIVDVPLLLSGSGVGSIGALNNLLGDNTWTGTVALGDTNSFYKYVYIGAENYPDGTPTNLTISGKISDGPSPVDEYNQFFIPELTKVEKGRVTLTAANNYGTTVFGVYGNTSVAAGYLRIEDSLALGPNDGRIVGVKQNASLELAVDNVTDSVTQTVNSLHVNLPLILYGTGVDGVIPAGGALHSISGVNTWMGSILLANIPLPSFPPLSNPAFYPAPYSQFFNNNVTAMSDGIGVEPDPNEVNSNTYFTLNNPAFTPEYSLTITGVISGPGNANGVTNNLSTLVKMGGGDLILPIANNYLGPTDIRAGWITAGNNQSLGGWIAGIGDTVQPPTTVESGAALMLLPLQLTAQGPSDVGAIPLVGGHIDLGKNLILNGTGISHKFALINHRGALQSLDGENVVGANYDVKFNPTPDGTSGVGGNPHSSWIQLNGVAGIGSEDVFNNGPNEFFTRNPPSAPIVADWTVGGTLNASELTSVAPIQDGVPPTLNFSFSASGSSAEQQFPIDTTATSGTITINYDMLSVPDNLRVYYDGARIFDSGSISGPGTFVIPYGPGASTFVTIIMNEGSGSPFTRWVLKSVKIVPNLSGGGSLVKLGSRRLDLQGPGTYTGTVEVAQGVLRVQNDTALGAANGNTVTVDSGGAIELAATNPLTSGGTTGGVDIQNKHLILSGPGAAGSLDYPLTNASGVDLYGFSLDADNRWAGPISLATASTQTVSVSGVKFTGSTTSNNATITNVLSTAGLAVGQLVSGNGIPANTTILSIGATSITLSNKATATANNVALVAGSFELSFLGQTTTPLPINATAAQVQAALELLSSIGTGNVTVTALNSVYTIVFAGALSGQALPQIFATPLSGATAVADVAFLGGPITIDVRGNDPGGSAATDGIVGPYRVTRLTLAGPINDVNSTAVTATDLIKAGIGELVLSGSSTYQGNTVVGFDPGATFTGTTSAGSTAVTGVSSTVGLQVGQFVTGPGIPPTTPISFTGNTTLNSLVVTNLSTTTGLLVGQVVSGPGIAPDTTIVSISGNTLTLSIAATGTGANASLNATNLRTIITAIVGNTLTLSNPATASGTVALTVSNYLLPTGFSAQGAALPGGILTVENSLALGASGSSVIVSNGASIQIQGSITISGKTLILEGNGSTTVPNVGQSWFNVGPAPINNGQNFGNQPVTGRVTGVAVDPTDPNVIYVTAGGGGAWKTIDGGKTWQPMIDVARVDLNQPTPGALVSTQNMYMGAIAISPTDPRILYVGIGESNNSINGDNYYGGGVLKSIDSGRTWTLIQPPSNGFRGLTISKIVVDPVDAQVIYVAVNDNGVNSGLVSFKGTTSSGSTTVTGVSSTAGLIVGQNVAGVGIPANTTITAIAGATLTLSNPATAAATGVLAAAPAGTHPENIGIWRYDNDTAKNTSGPLWSNLTTGKTVVDSLPYLVGVQTVAVNVPAGTLGSTNWFLTFNGQTTAAIPFGASALVVKNALNVLSTVGGVGGGVTVTGPVTSGTTNTYTITFDQGTFKGQAVSQLVASTATPGNGETVTVNTLPSKSVNALSGIVTFNQTYYQYTDVAVVPDPVAPSHRVIFFGMTSQDPTTPNQGGDYFDYQNNNVVPLALANTHASGIFTSIYDPGNNNNSTNQWYEFINDNGGPVADKVSGNQMFTHSGAIKLAVYTNPAIGLVTVDASIAYPTNWEYPGNLALDNSFREVAQLQLTFSAAGDPVGVNPVGTNGTPPFPEWTVPGGLQPPGNYLGHQGNYDQVITVTPGTTTPDLYVFGAGQSIVASTSTPGGFRNTTDIGVADANGNAPHVDYFASTWDSAGNLIVGTEGGVWRYNPTTQLWSNLNGDLNITQFNSVAVDPNDINRALGGSMNNSVELYTGGPLVAPGQAWKLVLPSNSYNGGQVAIDSNNPNILYAAVGNSSRVVGAATGATLMKSIDGGVTWTPILGAGRTDGYPGSDPSIGSLLPSILAGGQPGTYPLALQYPSPNNGLFPFVLDPANPNRLVVGSFESLGLGVYPLMQSLDGGQTWQLLVGRVAPFNNLAAILPVGNNVTGIALAGDQGAFVADGRFPGVLDVGANTNDSSTIYVTDGSGVYVTKNAGVDWFATAGIPGLKPGSISKIVADPRNRDTLFVVTSAFGKDHVFKTINAGISWTDISSGNGLPDLPTYAFVIDPRSGDLYVGNDQGVYKMTGGVGSWALFNVGMPKVSVRDLVLNQSLNTLTAATYGRGMYQLSLDNSLPNTGALVELSGQSNWVGPVHLIGDPVNNTVTIGADGTQVTQNGSSNVLLNIVGPISDDPSVSTPATLIVNKLVQQQGAVEFSGVGSYGGKTFVPNGILIVNNPNALGQSGPGQGTYVGENADTSPAGPASLELSSDLANEPVFLTGNGYQYSGHFTGALRNISNNNTYTGVLTLVTSSTIGVDTGFSLTIAAPGSVVGAAPNTLTKELGGTLVLATANTYDGDTRVLQGILNLQNATALGAAGRTTTVVDGAQLQMQGGTTVTGQTLDLSGTGIFGSGALLAGTGGATWAGPVSLDQVPSGSGTATVTTPTRNISIGVLLPGIANALTITGVISEAAANPAATRPWLAPTFAVTPPFGLQKVGAGVLVLNPILGSNTYAGVTDIQSGTLQIQRGDALGTAGNAPNNGTIVEAGASLQLSNAAGMTVAGEGLSLNGLGVGGAGGLENVLGSNVWSGTITLGITFTGNTTLGSPTILNVSSAVGLRVGQQITGPGIPPGTVIAAISSTGGVTSLALSQQATATAFGVALTGNDSVPAAFTGDTTSGSATIANVPNAAGLVVGQTVTGFGIPFATTITAIATNPLSGVSTVTLSQAATLTNVNVSFVGDFNRAGIGVDAGSQLTVSGVIQDNPPASAPSPVPSAELHKLGTGTLVLSGTNTYAGTTLVDQGILSAQNPKALGAQNYSSVQVVTVVGSTGPWNLTFNGQTTVSLPVGLQASGGSGPGGSVTNALNALSTIGGVGGSVTVTRFNNVYRITFGGTLAQTPVSLLVDTDPANDPTNALYNGTQVFVQQVQAGGGGDTVVANGATLQVAGGIAIDTESLILAGAGAVGATGALENFSGNNQFTKTGSNVLVDLTGNPTLTIDGPTQTLTLPGSINYGSAYTYSTTISMSGGTPIAGILAVNGNLNLTGATLAGTVLTTPPIGSAPFQIISTPTGTVSGTFANDIGSQVSIGGNTYHVTYNANSVFLNRVLTASKVTVSSSANPSVWGQDVTFTVTVAPLFGGPFVSGGGGTVTISVYDSTSTLVGSAGPLTPNALGQVTYDIGTALPVGTYTVQATFAGDSLFGPSDNLAFPFTQTVNKASTTTTLSGANPIFDQTGTITATITAVAPGAGIVSGGTVTFTVNGVVQTPAVAVVGGTAVYTLTAAQVGVAGKINQITATYSGDVDFLNSSTTSILKVTTQKAATTTSVTSSANPSLVGNSVTFTATVSQAGATIPNGSVTFVVDGIPRGTVALSPSGQAISPPIAGLTLGNHTVVANYAGATNFLPSSSSLTQVVHRIGVSVVSSANPSVWGQDVTLSGQVLPVDGSTFIPGTGGTLQFDVMQGATLIVSSGPLPVNSTGQATFDVGTGLAVGSYTVLLSYSGVVGTYPPADNSASPFTQVVNMASTTTTLTPNPAQPVVGQSDTITATVSPVLPGGGTVNGGTVTFTLNGIAQPAVPVTSGTATLTLTAAQVGVVGTINTITATYSGDGVDYLGSSTSSTLVLTTQKVGTTTTVVSSGTPSLLGNAVSFTATVAQTSGAAQPTGAVTFVIDGISRGSVVLNLVGGSMQAGILISGLTVGTHTVVANYGGAATFNASSNVPAFIQTVQVDTTTTTVTTSLTPSVVGWPVTLTATVTDPSLLGTPNGSVTFSVGTTVYGTALLTGSGGTATGSITVTNLPISPLAGYAVKATYSGSSAFVSSFGTVTQVISPTGSDNNDTVTVTGLSTSFVGQPTTFTATIAGDAVNGAPGGYVAFIIDGVSQPLQPVIPGASNTSTATITNTFGVLGNHTIAVRYTGDFNYQGPKTSTSITDVVKKPTATLALTPSSNPAVIGAPVQFTANVAGAFGTPTGTVSFYQNGILFKTLPLSAGSASVTLTYSTAGNRTIKAVYSGSTTYLGSNATVVETVKAPGTTLDTISLSSAPAGSVMTGIPVTFTADVNGSAGAAPTGWVTFFVDGVKKGQVQLVATPAGSTTDSTAQFTFTFTTTGLHKVTAQYTGEPAGTTPGYEANSTFITETVTAAPPAPTTTTISSSTMGTWPLNTTVPNAPTTFTAHVTGASGTPTGTVSFYNNSVLIKTVALSGGAASITIKLPLGNHTIQAKFNSNAAWLTSSASLVEKVVAAGSLGSNLPTTTTLTPSLTNPATGQPVSFVATVNGSAGVPTGWVIFYIGGVAQAPVLVDASGTATLTFTFTSSMTTTVYAVYTGDPSIYRASKSNTVTMTVATGRLL